MMFRSSGETPIPVYEAGISMLRLAPLIVRNVLRSKRRTLLSLASTAISLAILTFMVAMFQGFFYADDVSNASALRMMTRHKVALVQPLPISHMQTISSMKRCP